MTRSQLALHLVNRFRREKNPPYTRYGVLLAASIRGDAGGTSSELARDLGEATDYIASSLDRLVADGSLRSARGTNGHNRYFITLAGAQAAGRLLAAPLASHAR